MEAKPLSAGDWFFGTVLRMGANWKTTLSGVSGEIFWVLTVLSIAPYSMGDLSMIIPPKVKGTIASLGMTAAAILKIWNAFRQKDKDVTGGDTQQTLDGSLAKPGVQTLVDETVKATINSGGTVTPEQRQSVRLSGPSAFPVNLEFPNG